MFSFSNIFLKIFNVCYVLKVLDNLKAKEEGQVLVLKKKRDTGRDH